MITQRDVFRGGMFIKYALLHIETESLATYSVDSNEGGEFCNSTHVVIQRGDYTHDEPVWLADSESQAEAVRLQGEAWYNAGMDHPKHAEGWKSEDWKVVMITLYPVINLYLKNQTCFDCVHSKWHPGIPYTLEEPGEDGWTECTNKKAVLQFLDTGEETWEAEDIESGEDCAVPDGDIAKDCSFFDPIIVTHCHMCGEEINVPRHQWHLFAYSAYSWAHTVYPVCSEECRIALQEKVNEEEEELKPKPRYQ